MAAGRVTLRHALAELTALLDRVEAIENTAQNEERSVLWRRISHLVAAITRRRGALASAAPSPVPRTGAQASAARRWGARLPV